MLVIIVFSRINLIKNEVNFSLKIKLSIRQILWG